MDLQAFTGFSGRIGRQTWWIGTIIMIVVSLVLYFILSAVMGTGMSALSDPAKLTEPGYIESVLRKAGWQQLIMLAILAYPATALMAKRLNDRDRPGWYKWVFWAPTVLSTLLAITGMAYTMVDMGGIKVPSTSTLMTIVSLLSLVIGIWALVELGILRGTQGQNQHGPDPVG